MWKRKKEWPWYRARNYRGNLTEAEKRQLDAFRMQQKHPAANLDDLPDEVRRYLSNTEFKLYDKKQDEATGRAVLYSVIAGRCS